MSEPPCQYTPRERARLYSAAFPKFPPLRADDRWLDGAWILGNDYRGSGFYGSYPPGYLKRIRAILPEMATGRVLHAFSGSLSSEVPGVRVDLHHKNQPNVAADVTRLPFGAGVFDVVLADPPYSVSDAVRYATPMVNRAKAVKELARVTKPGGILAWMDTVWPMFSKRDWHHWGFLPMARSTNHRVRAAFLFERIA